MKNSLFTCILILSQIGQIHGQKINLVIPMGHAQKVNQIEVNHSFTHLGSIDDSNIIHIWDAKTKRELYQLKEHLAGIVSIKFHPSKNELISSDQDGVILIWDYQTSTVLKRIETNEGPILLNYSKDGKSILTGSKKSLKKLDSSSGSLQKNIDLEATISTMDVAPYNGHLAVGLQSGALVIFDQDLQKVFEFKESSSPITTIGYFPDKEKLCLGRENGQFDVVNVDKQKLGETSKIFAGTVGKLLVDHTTSTVVAVGNDPNGYVRFLKTSLEDKGTSRFKWSSAPTGNKGLTALAWADSARSRLYIADHANVIREWKMDEMSWADGIFKGTARPIYDIDIDSAKQKLIIGSKQTQVKVYDLTGNSDPILLEGHNEGIVQLDYHPDKNLVVAASRDGEIKIWNTVQQELKARIKKADYLDYNIQFTDDRTILRKVGLDKFELFSFKNSETKPIVISGASDFKMSPNGTFIVFQKISELAIYRTVDMKLDYTILNGDIRDFSFAGNKILLLDGRGTVNFYDRDVRLKEIPSKSSFDRIIGFESGDFALIASEKSKLKSHTILLYSQMAASFTELSGHNDYISQMLEVNGNLLSASLDGSIKIWKKNGAAYKEAGTIIPLRHDNFVITTPEQLFDASAEAMKDMHYTRGNDIIALEQLKDTYYEPNLLPKLLGFSGKNDLRKPLDISKLGIYPELEVTHPNLNNGKLGIKITNKGGGIGRVVLVINGKEVASDVREIKDGNASTMGIEYDIQGHPYMYEDKVNKITIKAYNKDGTLGSEPHNILVLPTGNKDNTVKPRIFAIVIGSSDYANDDLDLTYAAKDAQDFAAALKMSSGNLIGGSNIVMTLLTTNQPKELWPTKENIKKTFEKYSNEAKARDYLVVYMAGHGVNSGGDSGDFYYLTCTASEGQITNPQTKSNDAISSAEFTEYIKKVPALKQVMIVDACHSGTLTSSFGKTEQSRLMDSEEVRAFERMKDRTGLFLLAGSAADAVSYETTLYGQGLLTYALLFGMKGAALRDGEYIDVLDLFQFAAKKVPQLAADIGGIQRPEVRVPSEVESFNIGKMTDESKSEIKLLSPKPVFIQTSFQDINEFQDGLNIGAALNSKLMETGKSQNSPLVYINESAFSGAYQVRGRYEQTGGLIMVDVKVFQDNIKTSEFKTQGTTAADVSDKILNRLMVDYK
jgi:WD40 repeat protein